MSEEAPMKDSENKDMSAIERWEDRLHSGGLPRPALIVELNKFNSTIDLKDLMKNIKVTAALVPCDQCGRDYPLWDYETAAIRVNLCHECIVNMLETWSQTIVNYFKNQISKVDLIRTIWPTTTIEEAERI